MARGPFTARANERTFGLPELLMAVTMSRFPWGVDRRDPLYHLEHERPTWRSNITTGLWAYVSHVLIFCARSEAKVSFR